MATTDDGRTLRNLGARLLALHAALLGVERARYEAAHGATTGAALLRLLLEDEEFAWLRSLSAMIAQIDEALDGDEPVSTAAVDAFVGETYRLLRAGAGGAFETKYREALQRSPEVVMAHADVMKVLPPPKERAS